MDRKGLLRRWLVLAAPLWALAARPAVWAECPIGKGPSAKPVVIAPPPTVLPPPGFPPPAVYGFPTTGYRSVWYNTHYWPRKTYHHGFYGDYWQSGIFPGY
jgi:hypothetical protein